MTGRQGGACLPLLPLLGDAGAGPRAAAGVGWDTGSGHGLSLLAAERREVPCKLLGGTCHAESPPCICAPSPSAQAAVEWALEQRQQGHTILVFCTHVSCAGLRSAGWRLKSNSQQLNSVRISTSRMRIVQQTAQPSAAAHPCCRAMGVARLRPLRCCWRQVTPHQLMQHWSL